MRDLLRKGVTTILALGIASGMSEAEAQEVAFENVERIAEQDTYYRQKNVIIRFGTAGYYVKDSTSNVAHWAAFAVDFFNPVEDVMVVTDMAQDLGQFGINQLHEVSELFSGYREEIARNIQTIRSEPTSLWRMGRQAGVYRSGGEFLRELFGG
jgi:hypothetical protein